MPDAVKEDSKNKPPKDKIAMPVENQVTMPEIVAKKDVFTHLYQERR